MSWLNRFPFLDSVILLILSVAGVILRALPGLSSVVYRIEVDEVQGGTASFVLSVERTRKKRLPPWESLPYEFEVDHFADNPKGISLMEKGRRGSNHDNRELG